MRDATVINNWTKAWQDLTREDKPRQNRCDQRGDTHEDGGGRNIGEKRHEVVVRGTKRCLGNAVPTVVVGHIRRVFFDPTHGQNKAIIRGIRTEDVPKGQDGRDNAIEWAHLLPGRWHEANLLAVQAVHTRDAHQGSQHHDGATNHGDQLDGGWRRSKPRVDFHVNIQPGIGKLREVFRGIFNLGKDPNYLRTQVIFRFLGEITNADGGAIFDGVDGQHVVIVKLRNLLGGKREHNLI